MANQNDIPATSLSQPGGVMDEMLSQIDGDRLIDEEQEPIPAVQHADAKREITIYGAMLIAVDAAVVALRGRSMTSQAAAFRAYLNDLRNELIR